MRILSTWVHGILDYVLGLVLLLLPYVLVTATGSVAEWAPVALGTGLLIYSLATDYEHGVLRVIPMRVHLALDAFGGAVLVGVAALYRDAWLEWLPFAVLGVGEIAVSLLTRSTTDAGEGLERPPVLSPSRDVSMPEASPPRDADQRPKSPVPPRQVQNC